MTEAILWVTVGPLVIGAIFAYILYRAFYHDD